MRTLRLVAVALIVGLTLAAGPAGLLAGLTFVAAAELVGLRAAMYDRDRRHRFGWVGPGKRSSGPDLPSYRRIYNEVSRGRHSRWEFDRGLRRRLQRIMAVGLIESDGIDVDRQPDRARARIGPELWPLLDPHRIPTTERGTPGVPRSDLAEVLDVLEEL